GGLKQAGYNPKEHFLASDRYQMASLLSFYTEGQKRAYFFNIHRLRKNQFSYWPGMDKAAVGKTGYFVIEVHGIEAMQKAQKQYEKMKGVLAEYFSRLSLHPIVIPLYEVNHNPTKVILIIRCEDYNGKLPPETNKY
ncbi:MAG TPA: hypothetical protein VN457_02140, partial [Chlamydiales bacterium]|nr:hypothetical protein [Chlamydiales bacterium]